MVVVAPPRAVVLSALAMLLIGFASISTLRSCVAAELIMINSPICEWCDTWEDEVASFTLALSRKKGAVAAH